MRRFQRVFLANCSTQPRSFLTCSETQGTSCSASTPMSFTASGAHVAQPTAQTVKAFRNTVRTKQLCQTCSAERVSNWQYAHMYDITPNPSEVHFVQPGRPRKSRQLQAGRQWQAWEIHCIPHDCSPASHSPEAGGLVLRTSTATSHMHVCLIQYLAKQCCSQSAQPLAAPAAELSLLVTPTAKLCTCGRAQVCVVSAVRCLAARGKTRTLGAGRTRPAPCQTADRTTRSSGVRAVYTTICHSITLKCSRWSVQCTQAHAQLHTLPWATCALRSGAGRARARLVAMLVQRHGVLNHHGHAAAAAAGRRAADGRAAAAAAAVHR